MVSLPFHPKPPGKQVKSNTEAGQSLHQQILKERTDSTNNMSSTLSQTRYVSSHLQRTPFQYMTKFSSVKAADANISKLIHQLTHLKY